MKKEKALDKGEIVKGLYLRLPVSEIERARATARAELRSVSNLVRVALRKYCENGRQGEERERADR